MFFRSVIFFILILFFASGFFVCPSWQITGIPCPMCGSTRALFALIEGNFHKAFEYNLFIPVWIWLFVSLSHDYLFAFKNERPQLTTVFFKFFSLKRMLFFFPLAWFSSIYNLGLNHNSSMLSALKLF